jgi:hypothetical protein
MRFLARETRTLFPASLVLLALLAFPAASPAAVPGQVSYQGLLTDGSGNPVADGNYALAFSLYAASSGGSALWTETQPTVAVSKGSFSVLLGSVNPLTLPFDAPYWLGLSVNGGAELVPRVALASSPYALSLKVPFRATSNDSTPTVWAINPAGWDALRVSSTFKIYPSGANPAIQQMCDPTGNTSLQLLAGGNTYDTSLFITNPNTGGIPAYLGTSSGHPGGNYGDLVVGGKNNSRYLRVDGFNGGTGDPKLTIVGVANTITLDPSKPGDLSVQLPAGAIGPTEVTGFPGLTQSHEAPLVQLGATPVDVESTTVNVPAPGYVSLEASGTLRIDVSTNNSTFAAFWIDDLPLPGIDNAQSNVVGLGVAASPLTTLFSAHAMRTYFKTPGTYTFHFKGSVNGSGVPFAAFSNVTFRAIYLGASYGGVQTSVLASETPQFERATPIASTSSGAAPAFAVDLRELELRAARASAEAEKARNALLEAEAAQFQAELLRRNTPPAARPVTAAAAR